MLIKEENFKAQLENQHKDIEKHIKNKIQRAKRHLEYCGDTDCRYNLKKKCCYGLRKYHCIMVMSEPTKSNKQIVAETIEEWYIKWKSKITFNGEPHSLGFAKEDLKRRLDKIL